jgi:hypothetical protein
MSLMASCGYCATTIVFGGKRDGEQRFCNAECQQKGRVAAAAQEIPDALVAEHVWKVHQGLCSRCGGSGPIDVHTSYRVWSALYVTSWSSRPNVVCRRCGSRARLGDAVFSLALGWWGFPWGLLMTPVQVFRNVAGLLNSTDPTTPSPQLSHILRLQIAASALEATARRR